MAKARIGLYKVAGESVERTHRPCPKCGPGIFLADHENRRSCGRCGYSEARAPSSAPPAPMGKPRPAKKA